MRKGDSRSGPGITLKNYLTCSLQGTARSRIDEQRQPRLGSPGILHPEGFGATSLQGRGDGAVGKLLVGWLCHTCCRSMFAIAVAVISVEFKTTRKCAKNQTIFNCRLGTISILAANPVAGRFLSRNSFHHSITSISSRD